MAHDRDFSELKTELLNRRRELLELNTSIRSRWQSMNEAETEPEENASKENRARQLERLDRRGQEELDNINDALSRIENGQYGFCDSCGEPISAGRLKALPWARECVDCAGNRQEFSGRESLSLAQQIEADALEDDEVVEAIWEEIERQDDLDPGSMEISYTNGTVLLTGSLPREDQHQALLELIHDEIGIDDVIDRLEIDESVFEARSDLQEPADFGPDDKRRATEGEGGEADPHTAMEENEPMVPPDRFISDDER